MLDMWEFVEMDYEKVTLAEKKHVEAEVGSFGKDPKFRGFDRNNEFEYINVTSFLIDDLDRFSRFKARGGGRFNSHMPVVETYRRMVRYLSRFVPPSDQGTFRRAN
jgi:uncharacterized protein YfbU (UPF0304 family)